MYKALALLLVVGLPTVPSLAQETPAARLLTEARQALGGDSALNAIQTLSVRGTRSTNMGSRTFDRDLEIACALPDRCVQVGTQRSEDTRIRQYQLNPKLGAGTFRVVR